MAELKKNTVHPVTIQGCSADGAGVGRLEGMAVFVPGTIRGEVWDVQLLKVDKRMAWGRGVRLITPSASRLVPDCPHAGPCGGCRFRHMDYAQELEEKRRRAEDALRRIGGTEVPVTAIHGSAKTNRYRNKVQFPVAQGRNGVHVGLYRARSHDVLDVEDCLLQPEDANRLGRALKSWMEEHRISAYDESTGKGLVRHLYVRTNQAGESLACVVVNGEGLPQEKDLTERLRQAVPKLMGVVLNKNTRPGNVILGQEYCTLWGRDYLEEELCGLRFRLSVPSFFQVNTPQAQVLYNLVLELAGLTCQETVVDLYCGVGTITLCLARQAGRVIGVEAVPQAVEDARANAERNGVKKAEFFCGDAGDIAAQLAREGVRPQVITVDPPRKGLAPEVAETIAEMGPERVVYVSCDPATLARDVKRFGELGYVPVTAQAVDLFPRTAHVETVVLLSKLRAEHHIEVDLDLDEMDLTSAESKATYEEIKAYVLEQFGLKVSHLYISQVKRKCGLEVGQNYNLPKSEGQRVPQCPPEKEKAIMAALEHFRMI